MKAWIPALAMATLSVLQGCAQQPLVGNASYCDTIRGFRTCITGPIPSIENERQAKLFASRPDVLTVYLIRNQINDRPGQVLVTFDGTRSVITIPRSMVRITLPAGTHELVLNDHGQQRSLQLAGRNGEVQFVQIHLEYGWVDYGYRFRIANDAETRLRAANCKLIGDVGGS
jgi:hypothetical protein